MKTTPSRLLLLLTLILASWTLAGAQVNARKEIKIPDIPGFLTLKCDLHMHTVFSDGLVWPTVRADEAWREGLDAIAITEHVEYHPHEEDLPVNYGRAYEIVKPRADMYGLLVIRGAEITRQMPPGHFNCLFVTDESALNLEDDFESIAAAADQGAFILWNHPGWRQPDEIPIWYDEHTRLYESRMMHGMEIVNTTSYYPLAHEWCLDKGITMLGNSDVHSPVHMDYELRKGKHRAITLVFSEERNLEAIKQALFAGRTAVYFEDRLFGKEEHLEAIFNQSLEVTVNPATPATGSSHYIMIRNTSEVPFRLVADGANDRYDFPGEIVLHPERTVVLNLRNKEGNGLEDSVTLPYKAENLLVAPDKGLPVKLTIEP